MRFEKGHKAATRQHIVEVASKSFRRDGVSAAGIAGIMGEAA
jgi:TetR/AcrR family transcriptional regulator, transcriptional repressor for nem operon